MPDTPTLADVQAAALRIAEGVRRTPLQLFEYASEATGNRVFVKLENHQRTGSFKERGALNKLLQLSKDARAAGVICASAGNHAQGVAIGARRLSLAATIVMPLGTPLIKVSACRTLGAEVILHGSDYDEAYAEARRLQAERSLSFVHPYDDIDIIAGQGTVGLEILEQLPETDCIVVPVGGGGLISGIATAVKAIKPSVQIYGVEAAVMPAMDRSLSSGKRVTVEAARSLADGLATRQVGELTFEIVRALVDGIATVEEAEIASAILMLMEREKTVVEGGGAVGLAALTHRRLAIKNKNVVLVLSGGNIDVNVISRIIDRGLVKDGRLVRLRVRLPDEPGALATLTSLIAAGRANIVEIQHQRAFGAGQVNETDVQVTLETRGASHIADLVAALTDAGYDPTQA